MEMFKVFLVLLLISSIVLCAEEKGRRRKVRRKVLRRPVQEVVTIFEPENVQEEGRAFALEMEDTDALDLSENIEVEENEEVQPDIALIEEDRAGRGYLDQYYAQFDQRVQESQADNLSKRGNPHPYVYVAKNRDSQNEYDLMRTAATQSSSHGEASDRRSSISEQRAFNIKMGKSPYSETLEQTASPGTRYVQHVSLPKTMGDETYMYSAVHPSEFEENEVSDMPLRKIMPGALYDGMRSEVGVPYVERDASYSNALDNIGYESAAMYNQGGQNLVYLTEPMKEDYDIEASSKSDYYEDGVPYVERDSSYSADSSSGRPGLGKFFGLTGTTSQNIQLGLTFTVPFLNVPLTSLNSLFSGNGIGDLFQGFDTSNLFAVGLVAAGAIFVLPMIIYWLTGINLSAFNWSRSDDDSGLPMLNVVRSIEEALLEYDIDTRTCLARTMCNQYQTKLEEEEISTAARISRGILDNLAGNAMVQKYVGENRISEALTHGTSKKCKAYYKHDVCPWDTTAIIKVATKLMTSGNIDFASIASAAAKVAASNLS